MNKKAIVAGILAGTMLLTGCGNSNKITEEELEGAYTTYADYVSIIVNGMASQWKDDDPTNYGMSSIYTYGDPMNMGFVQMDVNGDGVDELLLGEDMGEEADVIYDMFTVVKNGKEATVKSVFSGGERNRMYIDNNGILVNEGSNGAADSFEKHLELKNGELVEVKNAKESQTYENIPYDFFLNYVPQDDTAGVGMANPWIELSDAQALQVASGFPFNVPEGATDVHYYWNESQKMAQVQFGWDGVSYTARIASPNEATDISGLYINIDSESPLKVGYNEGTERRGQSDGMYYSNAQWYDVAPGIMYSVTAVSDKELDGFDITAACEAFYVPAQGEVG